MSSEESTLCLHASRVDESQRTRTDRFFLRQFLTTRTVASRTAQGPCHSVPRKRPRRFSVSFRSPLPSRGFSLVELVVVIMILGILAAIAVPNFIKTSKKSSTSAAARQLRVIDDALNRYYFENQTWPPSSTTGTVPKQLLTYIDDSSFSGPTFLGGTAAWVYSEPKNYGKLEVTGSTATLAQYLEIDAAIDDGVARTGRLRGNGTTWQLDVLGSDSTNIDSFSLAPSK